MDTEEMNTLPKPPKVRKVVPSNPHYAKLVQALPHAHYCTPEARQEARIIKLGQDDGYHVYIAWCPSCGSLIRGWGRMFDVGEAAPYTGEGFHSAIPEGAAGCPPKIRALLETIARERTLPENPTVHLATEWITQEIEALNTANEVTLRNYSELYAKWKAASTPKPEKEPRRELVPAPIIKYVEQFTGEELPETASPATVIGILEEARTELQRVQQLLLQTVKERDAARDMVDACRNATEVEEQKRIEAEGALEDSRIIQQGRENYLVILTRQHGETNQLLQLVVEGIATHLNAVSKSYSYQGWQEYVEKTREGLREMYENAMGYLNSSAAPGGEGARKAGRSRLIYDRVKQALVVVSDDTENKRVHGLIKSAIANLDYVHNAAHNATVTGWDQKEALATITANVDKIRAALLEALPPAVPAEQGPEPSGKV